jgi:hypothetical protein
MALPGEGAEPSAHGKAPSRLEPLPLPRSIRGFHVKQWTEGGMSLWAARPDDAESSGLVRSIQASQ